MWTLSLLLAACLLAGTESYFFESGYTHHYTYHAENSLFGQANITTVLKFHVDVINETENGHRLHSLTVDSIVQFVRGGVVMDNPHKWNLTKAFLFAVDGTGGVVLVHCHPEDHEELLVIKKAMVSVFSVTVKIQTEKHEWTYRAEESDHLGRLVHFYKARRTETGLKLERNFSSFDDAHRFHEKTLHYDHQGTLHKAETKDRVHLKDRSSPGQKKTSKLPGELPHKVETSGEFPEIETSATVFVKLESKRPSAPPPLVYHSMSQQTLETKRKEVRYALADVAQNITAAFDCIQKHPEKDDVNRSLCINELRDILRHLDREDYKKFVDGIFRRGCHNDTVCEDRHLVLIDVVARIGDVTSQELLMTHVLYKKPPVDEELRRLFIHCVTLERPIQKFVHAVESFCFGPNGEHHGTRRMNRTQSRACLAVGSLTRHLAKGGRHTLANRLADRLESWLEEHGKVDHHLSKRSTWLEDTMDEGHHISKAVLLHALGNAALTRSRRHLVQHAQPNRGHHVWRRAALDSLRHYTCEESATVLLDSLLKDEKHSVRQMALSVYAKHPRRRDVTRAKENTFLSQNYTYAAVVRVKRDVFEHVLFKFKVELPKIDWKKEVGTRDVGASFGLYFNNYVHALFKVLSGYVDVNAEDKLWAEIHVGLIGKQWDIINIDACYRGRLKYNMNLVKDFTVGMFEDITSAFDHVINRIMEPIQKAANELAAEYQDPATNEPKSGFDPLAQVVRLLPKKTEAALKSTVNLTQITESLTGNPLVSKVQQLAARAQSLMEDVHSEATDLYSNIKDAAVVALPYAEKEIRQTINTVLEKLGDVMTNPRQVFSFIERGQMTFQLAMRRILEGDKIIKQATSFLSGSRSTFMNAGEELQETIASLKQLVEKLKAEHSRRKREASQFDEMMQGFGSEVDAAMESLYDTVDGLEDKVLNATRGAKDLQEGIDKQALYKEVLKKGFQGMKEAIDMIKSRINALFGQKFHPKFPDQRRDCDDTCGCGYFTGKCRYGHPGIELKWEQDWQIFSPVAGLMLKVGDNSYKIEPASSDFTEYEIIMSNIVLHNLTVDEEGTFVDAGQPIAKPVGPNDCEESHFHLAMRRNASHVTEGFCYYVDPSPFLDRLQPIPKWVEECKHFTFKHILQTIDFDKLTEGFAMILEELKRFALDVGKALLVKVVDSLPDIDLPFLGEIKGMVKDFVSNIDLDPGNLKNLFKDGFQSVKSFMKDISTGQFSLDKIGGFLANAGKGLLPRVGNIKSLIGKAVDFLKNPNLGKLGSFSLGGLGRLVKSRGLMSGFGLGSGSRLFGGLGLGNGSTNPFPGLDLGSGFLSGLNLGSASDLLSGLDFGSASDLFSKLGLGGLDLNSGLFSGLGLGDFPSKLLPMIGGKEALLSALKISPAKLCPTFGGALNKAWSQSMCVPHDDCLGIDCDVKISAPGINGNVKVSIRVYPDEQKVKITGDGKENYVVGSRTESIGGITVLKFVEVKFLLKAEWQGRELLLSLSVRPYIPSFGQSLPEVNLVKNIRFDPEERQKRSVENLEELLGPFLANMESLPIDDITKLFSDFNFNMDDIVGQINGIQEAISTSLETNQDQAEPTMKAEFLNPLDHKDKGTFPVPGQNGELYVPFFYFIFVYPLGPCLFVMQFSAGGAFGVSFNVNVQALDSQMQAEFKPWISGKLSADLSLDIFIAKAGIQLIGYVLKTSFPLTINTHFKAQPVEIVKKLEVELIPVELLLKGYVQILWVINIKKTLWHWRAAPIRGTLWEKRETIEDRGPPRFQYCDRVDKSCSGGRSKRQVQGSGNACSVRQVAGRHPHDAAFRLEFSVDDDDSDLKLWYAIGDYPGGTNVVDWTEMRGGVLLAPAVLPCGIPLHFLVKARNSQGLETTGRCSVPTYDCTFPDGRVDSRYRCTSHPSKLSANVILYEDSVLKPERLYHGVGYSPSSYGHEVVDWLPLNLSSPTVRADVSGNLRHFSSPRPGRLTSTPKRSLSTETADLCAAKCLAMSTCVSFSHNQYLYDCELQEFTEGASAQRRHDGHFVTYERLGNALTAVLRYENLSLRHGTRYYVNADVENVLGYRATLTSEGTMVDFTPPEPGYMGDVIKEELTAAECTVSILQRCVDHVAGSVNHRLVVDGEGGTTVFNGNRKGQELRHTIENYHASVNWNGFKDEECGIHGYTFAVGSSVCGDDVAGFTDPHAHIRNKDDWTYTGLAKGLHLPDGKYYVTVQAVSDIIHGGDLVTTACHSTPFVIDTTPPSMDSVDEILFDETFRYLVVYYNATDVISGVARMEMGLGRTKYDVMIRRYLLFEIRGNTDNTYLVNEEFETEDGVPAWIRLKVVNNVGLSTTGSSDAPIILDNTAPLPGDVMDGTELGRDICCQNITTQICAQWVDFHDPDSNIESYNWGVGLTPGKDDVVAFQPLSSYDKKACVPVQLQHNVTYFSTVVAFNRALNQKSANATSDGLLVDITPPVPGNVSDGTDVTDDVNFTSETATVSASWRNFEDPESGLRPYSLSVYINSQLDKVFTDITEETFTDHSLSLEHGDVVHSELQATNRAGSSVVVSTDGMLVDHTPPELLHLQNVNQTRYQQRGDLLHFSWRFDDAESGIAEYRCVVHQLYHGAKTKFWPKDSDMYVVRLNSSSSTEDQLALEGLRLQNGAAYSLTVTALNRAKMATAEESEPVTVDTTPPKILKVSLARPDEEEEVNDDDQVEHVDGEPLWVTWDPHDSESGIASSQVCVGLVRSEDCLPSLSHTLPGSLLHTTSFDVGALHVSTDEQRSLYRVYVLVENGASLRSAVAASRPFLVLKANVAGVVRDGRGQDDVDFSHDMAAIAITFSGFESEACGIVGYEWGVGTAPYATDILPYSDFGLVLDDQGKGFAQAHVTQFEGQTYYSSVRAKTGHNCHEPYIVSSSDGFTVDTTPPAVIFHEGPDQVTSGQVVYQTEDNTLQVTWKVEDSSGLNDTLMFFDLFGKANKLIPVPAESTDPISLNERASSGDTIFSSLVMTDNAGNTARAPLPPVTFDYTPPLVRDLQCTDAVSAMSSVLTCTWLSMEEAHSRLTDIKFGLGSGQSAANLLNLTSVPLHSQHWSVDTEDFVQSSSITEFYVIVLVKNAAGLKTEVQMKIINDITPPPNVSVRVVTSATPGYHDVEQICQTSQDYIELLIQGLHDNETGIGSVEIALGSSRGRSDIAPFRQYPVVHGMHVLGGLALPRGSIVYATVRVTNTVGLYTIATSTGVAISPEPRVEVWDGGQDSDMDGQSELHVMQGTWHYSDPCPVLSVEWALRELGGEVITNFTAIPDNGHDFYNDALSLENLKTYINYVRVKDAMNRSFTAYSDGITVLIRQPDPAAVRDGLETNDVDFQKPTDRLSANWDVFGDPDSTLPSDHIVRYEAAVGTDRRFATTRADVHGFVDIGLATNFTFYGLNLTAKTATYYVTVRAYSGAGSLTESSSDGIKVGYSADVRPGEVQVDRYQSSVSSIRFSWTDFVSDMVITHYFVGVSSTLPPWDNATRDCRELLEPSLFSFDVYTLQSLQADSMAVIDGLNLTHRGTYYVTLVAQEKTGHCSAAISEEILVDTTPPVTGHVTANGTDADTVIFLHSVQTVAVSLEEFPDEESGIKSVEVELFQSETCNPDRHPDSLTSLAKISALNESNVAMRNLDLQENELYFLRVSVTNGAGLQTTATSRPLMLDTTPPVPGLVKLGADWTAPDRTFQSETESLTGMVALRSMSSRQACVTKVDLLSDESKQAWRVLTEDFSEDCVGFDDSGLHVVVQHNPYLTGVDRGAAQFQKMSWREGDYTFRMSPATGENILSGFALTSPSLSPPFLSQNGLGSGNLSTKACDPSIDICLDKNNKTESVMLTDTDYGVGLSFIKLGGNVRVLFWAQDTLKRKEAWIALDFDPGLTMAEYVLNLQKRVSDTKDLWDVTAVINGDSKAAISGLLFPKEFILSVYSWNIGDYVPPVTDQFKPFRTSTVVSAMSVPVEVRPLCSYGAPFQDKNSGISQIWVGVSDNYNATSNIAPYRLVNTFCLPCLRGCADICSSCGDPSISDDYKVMSLSLHGLLLQAANKVHLANFTAENGSTPIRNSSIELEQASEELQSFQLPTYYLDIRVVDHSGLATEVKSVGVLVDTSPPVINSLYCTDPEYLVDVAVLYLGNNHTVGVKWDVTEDVSGVRDVALCIGTQPGLDDVAATVKPAISAEKYVFEKLDPWLHENEIYFVTLKVTNEAGLTSEAWANFTVQTAAPDMSRVSVGLPQSVTITTLGSEKVALMERLDHLELNLDVPPGVADKTDVDYFEWTIGTAKYKDDVFPKSVIGTKDTRRIAIMNGFVHRDDIAANISVGDYARKNYSTDTKPDPSANKFNMEPGRCVYQELYGVSKSHTYKTFDVVPLCKKRLTDILLPADDATHELTMVNNTFAVDSDTSESPMKIKVKLSTGAVIAGVLLNKELNEVYGTSASAEFSPFIVRPDVAADDTSRLLKKRLMELPGPDVFLSPIANARLSGDLDVRYKVPASMDVPENSLVMIIFWNPETKRWETPEELCPMAAQTYDSTNRVLSTKLCSKVFSSEPVSSSFRRKRSTTNTTAAVGNLGPRMVTVAVVRNTTFNQPPAIQNASFTVTEDGDAHTYTISYTDDEGDSVAFSLVRQPSHGTADVTESGLVQYRPDPDFSGTDFIRVSGREELDPAAVSLGVVPNTVSFTVTVHVLAVNDPPDITYLPSGENNDTITQVRMTGPTAGNGVNMSVYIEGNTTTLATLGAVLFSDVDNGDTFKYIDMKTVNEGANFIVSDIDPSDPRLSGVSARARSSSGGKEMTINLTDGYSGHVTYDARVKDAAGAYSRQLTLNVYVLLNPCFHGHCQPRNNPGTCQHPQRAFTFDSYVCQCDLGYEGQWCETETNECVKATCSPITDCVDLVGEYRCDYNPTKLAAIIVCSLVAGVLGLVVAYRLKKKTNKTGIWWPENTEAEETEELKNFGKYRPGTARTTADIDIISQSEREVATSPEQKTSATPKNSAESQPATHTTGFTNHAYIGITSQTDAEIATSSADNEHDHGDFEFLNSPFFAYHPSKNPAAPRHSGIVINVEELPKDVAMRSTSSTGPSPSSANAPAEVKTSASPRNSAKGEPVTHITGFTNLAYDIDATDDMANPEAGEDGVDLKGVYATGEDGVTNPAYDLDATDTANPQAGDDDVVLRGVDVAGEDDATGNVSVTTTRPISTGSRHSTVSSLAENREMPKVEN